MKNKLSKYESNHSAIFKLFSAVFFPILFLYLMTASNSPYWQDAPMFLMSIKSLGIMHSPGFPLYIMLARVWVDIFSFITNNYFSFPYYVHSFSSFTGALAAFFVGLNTFEILKFTNKVHTKSTYLVVSIVTGLFTGTTYSLWNQSINAEVFSLLGLCSSVVFYLLIRIVKSSEIKPNPFEKSSNKLVPLLLIIFALSLSIHPAILYLLPGTLYVLHKHNLLPLQGKITKKRWLLYILVGFIVAFLPFLYLPLRSSANPEFMMGKVDSISSFINYITGIVYLKRKQTINIINIHRMGEYPDLFYYEFFIVGLLLGTLGVVGSLHKKGLLKNISFFLLISFLTNFLLLRGYEYNYYLISFYVTFIVFIGLGLNQVSKKINPKMVTTVIFGLALILPSFLTNTKVLNRSNFSLAEELGFNFLKNLPKDSILFTYTDHESGLTLYLQQAENFRHDVALLRESDFVRSYSRDLAIRKYPELNYPDEMYNQEDLSAKEAESVLKDFIEANIKNRDIFLSSTSNNSILKEYDKAPAGALWKLKKSKDEEIISLSFWDYSFSDPFRHSRDSRNEPERFVEVPDNENLSLKINYNLDVRDFEVRASLRLFELCYTAYLNDHELQIINDKGDIQSLSKIESLNCASTNYNYLTYLNPELTGGFSMLFNYTFWSSVLNESVIHDLPQ